jgi:nitrogen fixation NifU-like protein
MKKHDGNDLEHPDQPMDPRFWRHARFPKHTRPLANAHGSAMGVGSCGDKVTVAIQVDQECIEEIYQNPEGCLYTTACASAVSTLAKGRTLEEALEIQPEAVEAELGGLPEDHRHCARLAVNTLGEAIADYYKRIIQGRSDTLDVHQKMKGNTHAHL